MVEKAAKRAAQSEKTGLSAEYPEFYQQVEDRKLWPLWEEIHAFTKMASPRSKAVPCLWRYDEVQPLVMTSADMLTAEEAERRVLALENPGLDKRMAITPAMYAGYQLVMPGEIAPSHRHSPAAFRFILEGEGAYTAVNGEKTPMRPGDFVVTPSWCWHDHGNETDVPMIWLDGLDWPLVNHLGLWFFEAYPDLQYPAGQPPIDSEHPPVLNYTYEETRVALFEMSESDPFDSCLGVQRRYLDPSSGDDPMPTITAYLQLLKAGSKTKPYRQTDACVYSVVEGRGRTRVGDTTLEWGPRDAFVVPTWMEHHHVVDGADAVLFKFSDRGVQEKLGLWRELRSGD